MKAKIKVPVQIIFIDNRKICWKFIIDIRNECSLEEVLINLEKQVGIK